MHSQSQQNLKTGFCSQREKNITHRAKFALTTTCTHLYRNICETKHVARICSIIVMTMLCLKGQCERYMAT